jgi:hypothetical protein
MSEKEAAEPELKKLKRCCEYIHKFLKNYNRLVEKFRKEAVTT